MKIALLGATGKVGSILLSLALEKGHIVNALVRNPQKLKSIQNKNLKIIKGDALCSDDLENLVFGADIVISCLGHGKGTPRFMQRDVFKLLTKILERSDKKRIMTLTGSGVFLPNDTVTIFDRLLLLPIKLIDPARVEDGDEHVKVLLNSNLNWTVVRTPIHTSFGSRFKVTERLDGGLKLFVNRAHIANLLIDIAENGLYVKQAPVISSTI
jgi:putative NADH-flavin reductase